MADTTAPERFEVTLAVHPDSRSAAIRLRQVLKALLRGYRIRCEDIRPVHPPPPAPTELPAGPDAA